MNIFVTSPCPKESAEALDDKRVNKMLLESIQMLATALLEYSAPVEFLPVNQQGLPYRKTHWNHPCSIWARLNQENYIWLVEHAEALHIEFKRAYGKEHRSGQFLKRLRSAARFIPEGSLTDFANCSLYKGGDTIEQYRQTMKEKWAVDVRPPIWTNRSKPEWAQLLSC